MINKEPTVIIGGLAEIVRAIIPMLLIFSIVHWTDAQTGTIIFLVGVLVSFAEKLFIRSQVTPTAIANKQIQTAIDLPKGGTTVEKVIETTKEQNETT